MGYRLQRLIGSTFLFLLLVGCVSNGTEIGNPGGRVVAGKLTGGTAALVVQQSALSTASCPSTGGPVSLSLKTAAGVETVASLQEDGSFSAEISQKERYEVVFKQGDFICGHLTYGQTQKIAGQEFDHLYVVLGKGTQNIETGVVTDQGSGIFTAENNPSSFCDDNGNGETDDVDSDNDGDGISDTDNDHDGYIDWFKDTDVAP